MGDYSGFHHTLANQLRIKGHQCTVAGDGSRCMDTDRDIDIKRRPGLFNSFRYLFDIWRLVGRIRGYDRVQLINPMFLSLKPGKLKFFFDKLKSQNGSVGLSLCGNDSYVVRDLTDNSPFRYSEFGVGDAPTAYALSDARTIDIWKSRWLTDYCRHIYDNVDSAVSALYEYHVLAAPYFEGRPLVYTGIGVDTRSIAFEGLRRANGCLRILVGIKSEMTAFKGTDRLLAAALKAQELNSGKCEVTVARDLPLSEYLQCLREADVVVDQLYSYTPATNALQAMAMGKIVVSGAEPEFYDFIGEGSLRPIVNAVPDDRELVGLFGRIINMSDAELDAMSRQSRQFVEKHNSAEVVADRFLESFN